MDIVGKLGKFKVSGLKELQKEFIALKKSNDAFIAEIANWLARSFLVRVKERTPVGNYTGEPYNCNKDAVTGRYHRGSKSKRRGGTLRDSWSIGDVKIDGDLYVVEVINDAKNEKGQPYASYVEYGHRKRNGGHVEPHFMMEFTRSEIEKTAPEAIERKFLKKLKEVIK